MIKSFKDRATEALFNGQAPKGFSAPVQIARRKLEMLHAATRLEDLRLPPSNHLEQLKGDRRGQHSIRINRQYRVCFVWTNAGAEDVEIIDYH